MRAPPPPRFVKMNGLGNAILVVDGRGAAAPPDGAAARALCRGDLSFDQLMLIENPTGPGADAGVRIFNGDGSRAGACGNGARCVAWFLARDFGRDDLVLDIEGSRAACRREGEWTFTVDMGAPRFGWRDIPLRAELDTAAVPLGPILTEFGLQPPAAVSMGNPHAVFFIADLDRVDLHAAGPRLETHPMFPDRANISFARVRGSDRIALKVWERGAGATRACGSAACATLAAAARAGLTGRMARVELPGGALAIDWGHDGRIAMTGPVELEHEGTLPPVHAAFFA